jgi:malonate decarboxylase beta subunit
MGIVARCADRIVMSDMGRLAMSGPEVIEASHGVDEFDSRDRALVWRTTGGKHRWLTGDCDVLVEDDVESFRAAAIASLDASSLVTLEVLEAEHAMLAARLRLLPETSEGDDSVALWAHLGVADAARVTDLDVDAVRALRPH